MNRSKSADSPSAKWLLIAAFATAFPACGSKGDDDASKDEATSTSTSTSTAATTTPGGAESTKATSTATTAAASASPTVPQPTVPETTATTPPAGDVLAGYSKYTDAPGRYDIMLPGTPQGADTKTPTGVVIHQVSATKAGGAITVAWNEGPEVKDPKFLEGAKGAANKQVETPLITPIEVDGKWKGYDVVGTKNGSPFRQRMFVVEDRFYQVVVVGLKDQEAKAVVESMKVTPPSVTSTGPGKPGATALPAVCNQALAKMRACADKIPGPGGAALKQTANASEEAWKKVLDAGGAAATKGLETSCKATLDAQGANPLCK